MARKILLADDSVTAQNMGRKILADAGYEVIAVNNGSAALKKIAELKPDLVILDVYMPGYSGLEVCQRLKESQETARIPVLLTVGKLEPFKPEEAQRVRAEGYIVKPFEASELLSALSKLEDKVVPRSEPSKPGRFARAIAAAEESGRDPEISGKDNGWKSRINFPHPKAEEKGSGESSTSNPVNREESSVVATRPTETTEPAQKYSRRKDDPKPTAVPESSVDVAALGSPGLPTDVTPEEVAAIAAAAAQIQVAGAILKDEPRGAEQPSSEKNVSEGQISESVICATPVKGESSESEIQRNELDAVVSQFVAADEPVTMAATAESVISANLGGARWTAVSVALDGEEAALSLDQEMRKAAGQDESNTSSHAAAPYGVFSPAAEAVAELKPEVDSVPEPEPVREAAPAASDVANIDFETRTGASAGLPNEEFANSQASSFPEALSSANRPQTEAVASIPADAPVAPTEEYARPEFVPQNEESKSVAEPATPSAEMMSDSAAPTTHDVQGHDVPSQEMDAQDVQAAMPEAASEHASNSYTTFTPLVLETEPPAQPHVDSETVKTTAAAWASWRQIRDTGNASETPQHQAEETNAPHSMPAQASAMAVAAGAEQSMQEAAAAAQNGNPADVASIVDSVLADLRPKLMEEISRKMAEKK